jgi:AbrB family transcriptional regulator, transcriptional pleiotropic regulator of transition state genes
MRSTGIVRKVDELGRVVLPIELRRVLNINEKDPVEIFVDEEMIILQKYKNEAACVITGDISSQNQYYGNRKLFWSPKGTQDLLRELNESIG